MSDQKLKDYIKLIHEGCDENKEKDIEKMDWTFNMNKDEKIAKDVIEQQVMKNTDGQIKFETGIVLFKIHDLRLRDHEAIFQANLNCKQVVYLFIVEDD